MFLRLIIFKRAIFFAGEALIFFPVRAVTLICGLQPNDKGSDGHICVVAGSYSAHTASISTRILSSGLLWLAFPIILSCNKRKSFMKSNRSRTNSTLFNSDIEGKNPNSFFRWEIESAMLSIIREKEVWLFGWLLPNFLWFPVDNRYHHFHFPILR